MNVKIEKTKVTESKKQTNLLNQQKCGQRFCEKSVFFWIAFIHFEGGAHHILHQSMQNLLRQSHGGKKFAFHVSWKVPSTRLSSGSQ